MKKTKNAKFKKTRKRKSQKKITKHKHCTMQNTSESVRYQLSEPLVNITEHTRNENRRKNEAQFIKITHKTYMSKMLKK